MTRPMGVELSYHNHREITEAATDLLAMVIIKEYNASALLHVLDRVTGGIAELQGGPQWPTR